ncbi:hypothetical protein DMENIID0001_080100 [Sergentomyia squamirostris]
MEDFCKTNKKLLNWSGFWFEGDSVKNHQKLRCFFCLSITFVLLLCPEFYCIYQNRNDPLEISRVISEVLTTSLSFIKMIIFLVNQDKIRKLFNEMKQAWGEIEVSDVEVQEIKKKSMKRAEFVSKGFAYPCLASVTNFIFSPLVVYFVISYFKTQSIQWEKGPMPIRLCHPISRSNVADFSIMFTISTIVMYVAMITLMGFDTYSVALMNFSGDFFNILKICLKNLHNKYLLTSKDEWSVEDTENINNELKEIITRHNQLIDFSHRLEEIINIIMLAQYLASTFMFCVVGFQLSILQENPNDLWILGTYCFFLCFQLYMFSWFGSYLTTSSFEVGMAAYDCGWLNAPPELQKHIILIIQRSQRPLGVTASKFYYISIESFAKALSSAISYFTLLHSLYEN